MLLDVTSLGSHDNDDKRHVIKTICIDIMLGLKFGLALPVDTNREKILCYESYAESERMNQLGKVQLQQEPR